MGKNSILGVNVSNTSKEEVLEFILKGLEEKAKKLVVLTSNPEIIMFAQKDKRFKTILNSADLALPDGVGVMWAAKMLGKQLRERITGVDFMERLCEKAAKRGFTVGLIGGGPKIAVRTAECLQLKYPKLKIVLAQEEWPGKEDRELKVEDSSSKIEDRRWINSQSSNSKNLPSTINHLPSKIDILFVAFGFPKQERWIADHIYSIPVHVAMAVGGSFDFISGNVPRAPYMMRKLGFEWLFRLVVQPWRLRRQKALLAFVYKVFVARYCKNI